MSKIDPQKHRGIYLLPNLFTTANLFSGFYAVVAAMSGDYAAAAIAIFVAMVLDGVDGRVARLTNTQSAFGAEYDSMSDMVSFGMAPALVMYSWSLHSLGKLGWLAAFIYVAGAALRLARFNTQVGIADKRFFQGLASPAAAAITAGLVWVFHNADADAAFWAPMMALVTALVGVLMVSNFRYYSFKDVDWKGKVSFVSVLLVVVLFVVVATNPSLVLLVCFILYALSGPVITFRQVKKLKMEHVLGDSDDELSDEASGTAQRSKDSTQVDEIKPQ